MGDLHSGFGATRGYPPQTPASCRQLDHARQVLAIREFGGGGSDRFITCPTFAGDAPDLLSLLPAESVNDWQDRADKEFSIKRSQFCKQKQELELNQSFWKDSLTGFLIAN
jgi:hypothetical protein